MRRTIKNGLFLILAFTAFERVATAQLFGGRSFGRALTPQSSAGGGIFGGQPAGAQQGQISGAPGGQGNPAAAGGMVAAPRFLRGSRDPNKFVGTDAMNDPAFLMSRPAALDVTERRVPETLLNPPRTPTPRNRMYDPKLNVNFQYIPRSASDINANLTRQVSDLSQMGSLVQATVLPDGQTVLLQGAVQSEEQRQLIEQMMLFEPGISAVQNDLKVLSGVPSSF